MQHSKCSSVHLNCAEGKAQDLGQRRGEGDIGFGAAEEEERKKIEGADAFEFETEVGSGAGATSVVAQSEGLGDLHR
jgi:hypothetical protein